MQWVTPFHRVIYWLWCFLDKGINHLTLKVLGKKVDHVRILLNENNIDILCSSLSSSLSLFPYHILQLRSTNKNIYITEGKYWC